MEVESHNTDMDQTFIDQLTRITEENLTNEQFSVEELASAMGMSYTSLYRQLKCSTNKTISQFVREVRLKKANEILINEDITASEVAYRVGFGSPTYFNKCFHKFFGYAPGEFKKRELQSRTRHQLRFFKMNRKLKSAVIILALLFIAVLSFLLLRNDQKNSKEENQSSYKPSFIIKMSGT